MGRLVFAFALALSAAPTAAAAEPPDYLRDIKPVLKERCFACHGSLKQLGKLRLDGGANLLNSAVVPGKPDESIILDRVSDPDEATRMPPEGLPLVADQIAKLRAWIAAGAKIPPGDAAEADPRDHWAFRPPARPAVPKSPAANPIDAFILAKLAEHKLAPGPAADKRILLRRVTIDLTGLPPTAAEADAFLADPAADAYAKVVDRLLASPRYGERWGRHFLDVWRYSDWWGLGAEVRNSQKHMHHWRDWAVESFNADAGYDAMLADMLAADERAPADASRLRATGFLARQYFKFNRNSWLDETVEHAGKAFLGLTFNCAKCHDHKYDPISHVDYYQLRAVFEPYQVRTDFVPGVLDPEVNGVPRAFDCDAARPTFVFARGDEKQPRKDKLVPPGFPAFLGGLPAVRPVTLPPTAFAPHTLPYIRDAYLTAARPKGDAAVRAVEARYAADVAKAAGNADGGRLAKLAAAAEKVEAVTAAEKTLAAAETLLAKAGGGARIGPGVKRDKAAAALAKAKAVVPGDAYTPLRGAVKTAESNVEPDAIRNRPFPATSTGRRSALAARVTAPDNPLTARVAVNHLWLRHFGAPIVPTVFDFGRNGRPPSHPELLDWLAVELVSHDWSLKHLHRLMVTSDAYRRTADGPTSPADPENRFLAKMNPVRMDANAVRDGLLHLAGTLDETRGGPAVPVAQQEQSRRRGVYFFQSHNDHSRFLAAFDDANVLDCYRRAESIVPNQALALANSGFALTAAAAIAGRIPAAGDAEFVAAAFRLLLASDPTPAEAAACAAALAEFRTLAQGSAADRTTRARANLIAALVNHNDFITVR